MFDQRKNGTSNLTLAGISTVRTTTSISTEIHLRTIFKWPVLCENTFKLQIDVRIAQVVRQHSQSFKNNNTAAWAARDTCDYEQPQGSGSSTCCGKAGLLSGAGGREPTSFEELKFAAKAPREGCDYEQP